MQLVARVVALAAVAFAHGHQLSGCAVQFTSENIPHHLSFAHSPDFFKVPGIGREFNVKLAQRFLAVRVDKQPSDQFEEVVARGAVRGPGFRKMLSWHQDLLDADPGAG